MAHADKSEGRLVCRPATAEDYQSVMAINDDIYEGDDYLPDEYHKFLRDPSRHLHLGEVDGKVVAFYMSWVVDDGEAMVSEAIRVHPDYQHRGYMAQVSSHAMAAVKHRIPNITRIYWSSVNRTEMDKLVANVPSSKYIIIRPWMSMQLKARLSTMMIMAPEFQSRLTGQYMDQMRVLTPNEAVDILSSNINTQILCPDGKWMVNWEPFGDFVSNYELVTKTSVVMVSRNRMDDSIQALSFGTPVNVKLGLRYSCDFYCDTNNGSPDLMMAHVVKHLLHINQYYKEPGMSFNVFHPKHIKQAGPCQMFAEMGFEKDEFDKNPIFALSMDFPAQRMHHADAKL